MKKKNKRKKINNKTIDIVIILSYILVFCFISFNVFTLVFLPMIEEKKDMQKYLYEQTGTIYDDRELLKTCLKIGNRIISFKDLSIINNYPEIKNLPRFKEKIEFYEEKFKREEEKKQESIKKEEEFQRALKEHELNKKLNK